MEEPVVDKPSHIGIQAKMSDVVYLDTMSKKVLQARRAGNKRAFSRHGLFRFYR
jgi:hypothetical protein